jgi:hypothetical protein
VVPSGTCTYTTPVAGTPSLTINKAITVQGQTVCTGRAATLSCTDRTIISDGTGTMDAELAIVISASGARLTGFSFVDTRTVSDTHSPVQINSNTTGWRIDHSHFHPTNPNNTRPITAAGYGLIDHVLIQDGNPGISPTGTGAGDVYEGDVSWTQPEALGSANAVYIEDSKFDYTQVLDGAFDGLSGARVVFRYNYTSGTAMGSHGLDSGGGVHRSTMVQEIYGNTITIAPAYYAALGSRGGTSLVFNNTITGPYGVFMSVRNYRSDASCVSSGMCINWGVCDGTNSLDQNTQPTSSYFGWPCKDQIGRGANQGSYPQYSWSNSYKGGSPIPSNFDICGWQDCTMAQTYHVLWNRDIFNEVAGFNGAAGVGSGLLSGRPGTCTPNVAYWATDMNTLYQCSSTNTWTAYYKPYTYPHPLQAGTTTVGGTPPKPPTGLTSVVIK